MNKVSTSKKRVFFKSSIKYSSKDILGIFVISTIALNIINLFVLFMLYGSYSQLSKKNPPTLVELANGDSLKVTPIGSQERSPQAVLHFVSSTLSLMFNWSGTVPTSDANSNTNKPKADPGVDINSLGGKGKVSIAAWEASYALSSDFRKQFLQLIAQMTPQGVFEQKTQVVFMPIYLRQPIQISQGKWKIKVVANLNIFDRRSNVGEIVPFNKEIFVRAVEVPEQSPSGGLASLINHIRSSGLEIYAIRNLKEENL